MLKRIMLTHAPKATVLMRLVVGAVFLPEGMQKFLFPADARLSRKQPAHAAKE